MGTGKSTAIINYIKNSGRFGSDSNKRFIIFVVTENERDNRFIKELPAKKPDIPPLRKSILDMIVDGDNIVTTQALCSVFNDETIAAFQLSEYKYTAFFDEIPALFTDIVGCKRKNNDFGNIICFGKADVKLMQTNNIVISDNQQIFYNQDSDYAKSDSDSKIFDSIRQLGSRCDLFPYGRDKDGYFTSIIAFAKRSIFECFNEIWFCSYLTKGSMLDIYCNLNDINIVYYHIDDKGDIANNPAGKYIESYPAGLERIEILDSLKFNMNNSLSKDWYSKANLEKNKTSMKVLAGKFRNAYEFMKKHGVTAKSFIWTTFKEYRNNIKINNKYVPVNKTWLACNTKATNDYSNCTGVAYVCNRFFDVNCTNYLSQLAEKMNKPELKFNNDIYALSELIQFIYRSNIRVKDSDKKIYVWVPDYRMRNLLYNYREKALKFHKITT